MDKQLLKEQIEEAIWAAKSLFDRGKTAGSSANLSFRYGGQIYITGTNTCFGRLAEESFSILDLGGKHVAGVKPSKEFPLHCALYAKDEEIQAVIHTHSFYATLWSCLPHEKADDAIPSYTPYLGMKLGKIQMVPYFPPGSAELFQAFQEHLTDGNGYLLKNHGPIVAGKTLLDAFYALEELEESARIAVALRNEKAAEIGREVRV